MSRCRITAVVIAAVLTASIASSVLSQRPAPVATAGRTVVVADMPRIIKNWKHFQVTMQKLNAEGTELETALNGEAAKIKAESEAIEELPTGSEERRRRRDEANKARIQFPLTSSIKMKAFQRKSDAVHNELFREMLSAIEGYAKAHGIEIVIRANSELAEADNPQGVSAEFNKPVVWSSPDADITTFILDALNRRNEARQ